MNYERARLKGELTDAKKRLVDLDMLASGQIVIIRQLIDPYAEDVATLDTRKALVNMEALDKTVAEMRELKNRIARLEDGLNG